MVPLLGEFEFFKWEPTDKQAYFGIIQFVTISNSDNCLNFGPRAVRSAGSIPTALQNVANCNLCACVNSPYIAAITGHMTQALSWFYIII